MTTITAPYDGAPETPDPAIIEEGDFATMKPISTVITDFIDTAMSIKNLGVYCSEHGKIFVLDEEYNTLFKFDLVFSDNDFSCQILVRQEGELVLRHSFNIPWTNGKAIRTFMKQVEGLYETLYADKT